MNSILTKYFSGGKINLDEMERDVEKAKNPQSFGGETWEKWDHFEKLEIEERVKLKWMLQM